MTIRDAPSTPRFAEEPTGEEWQVWSLSNTDVDKLSERELRCELKFRRREQKDHLEEMKRIADLGVEMRSLLKQTRNQITDLIGYER